MLILFGMFLMQLSLEVVTSFVSKTKAAEGSRRRSSELEAPEEVAH